MGARGVERCDGRAAALIAAISLALVLPPVLPAADLAFTMLQPDCIGEARFLQRLDQVRAQGREPLGLVLSGGLARSYAHLGLLEVMEERGLRPDFIVGDSLGGVIGLLYAAGLSPKTIVDISELLAERRLFDLVLPTSGGLLHAGKFAAALALLTGDPDIADLPIPVLVIADDLKSGRQVRIAAGALSEVALASVALPLLFEPVPMGSRLLVDGGSTDLVPVAVAREYSGQVLVSTALHNSQGTLAGLVGVLMRSFDSLLVGKAARSLAEHTPLVVRNEVEHISNLAFDRPSMVADLGAKSAGRSPDLAALSYRSDVARVEVERPRVEVERPGQEPALAAFRRALALEAFPSAGAARGEPRAHFTLAVADRFDRDLFDRRGERSVGLDFRQETGMTRRSLEFRTGVTNLALFDGSAQGGAASVGTADVAGSFRFRPLDILQIEAGIRMLLPTGSPGRLEAAGALSGLLPIRQARHAESATQVDDPVLMPYVRASAASAASDAAGGGWKSGGVGCFGGPACGCGRICGGRGGGRGLFCVRIGFGWRLGRRMARGGAVVSGARNGSGRQERGPPRCRSGCGLCKGNRLVSGRPRPGVRGVRCGPGPAHGARRLFTRPGRCGRAAIGGLRPLCRSGGQPGQPGRAGHHRRLRHLYRQPDGHAALRPGGLRGPGPCRSAGGGTARGQAAGHGTIKKQAARAGGLPRPRKDYSFIRTPSMRTFAFLLPTKPDTWMLSEMIARDLSSW